LETWNRKGTVELAKYQKPLKSRRMLGSKKIHVAGSIDGRTDETTGREPREVVLFPGRGPLEPK